MSTRLIPFMLTVLLGSQASAQSLPLAAARESTQVVFVCEHGSVKSLVASLYFNQRARERGLPYRAVARGVAPESTVPLSVRRGLQADGFQLSDFAPQAFEASEADRAALVVSFDQDIARMVHGKTRHLKWDDLPEVVADYPHGRDAIVRKVDALIDELSRKPSP